MVWCFLPISSVEVANLNGTTGCMRSLSEGNILLLSQSAQGRHECGSG